MERSVSTKLKRIRKGFIMKNQAYKLQKLMDELDREKAIKTLKSRGYSEFIFDEHSKKFTAVKRARKCA